MLCAFIFVVLQHKKGNNAQTLLKIREIAANMIIFGLHFHMYDT